MKLFAAISICLATLVLPASSLASGGATIAKRLQIEGRRIRHDCSKSVDFYSCLIERGFSCELFADGGNESYFCQRDAPPGRFEIFWSRADTDNSAQIKWIDDR